jgi:hypothetical protein
MLRIIFLIILTIPLLSCSGLYKAATGTYKYYQVSAEKVEYYSWNPMSERYSVRILKDADPETFKQIATQYGKDKNSVYFGSQKIEGAQPNSFYLLNEFYAVDENHAYVIGQIIPNSDAKSFEYIGKNWAKDNDSYFYKNIELGVCDFKTFKIAPDKYPSRGSDKYCYFYEGKRVPIKDMDSFELFYGNYAKDKYDVYWGSILITKADPKTFVVKEKKDLSIAKDKDHCFSGPQTLSCNDLNKEALKFCGCSE